MIRPQPWLALSVVAHTAIGVPARGEWAPDGVAVCTAAGEQLSPQLISDGIGGAIAVWEDLRSPAGNIYAQRLDASGVPLWTPDGVAVCPSQFDQLTSRVVADGMGGAIIAWEDVRDGIANKDIYAQRLTASGARQWAAAGVPVCRAPFDQSGPKLISDGAGGAIIAWTDPRGGSGDIYAQRINAAGVPLWGTDGVAVCDSPSTQGGVELIADGSGGAIAVWSDFRTSTLTAEDLYVQRLNASGVRLWNANGVAVCATVGNQTGAVLSPDGSGGAFIAWADDRSDTLDVYAQRISNAGTRLWSANGVPVCTAQGNQFSVVVITAADAEAIVAWQDMRSGNSDVYAQRIGATGSRLWALDGVGVAVAPESEVSPGLVPVAGGATIAWQEVQRSGDTDLYAQQISPSGNLDAAGATAICTAPHDQGPPRLVPDGLGGAILAWQDHRDPDYDIFAQKMGGPTPITLQEFMVTSTPDGVWLTWQLATAELYTFERIDVQRALDVGGPWVERASLQPSASMSFEDTEVESGRTYWYRLLLVRSDGVQASVPVSVVHGTSGLHTILYPAVENADGVVIRYALAAAGQLRLEVLDVSGRRVRTLAQDLRQPGEYFTAWDRTGQAGTRVARGVYLVRLRIGAVATARKLLLLR